MQQYTQTCTYISTTMYTVSTMHTLADTHGSSLRSVCVCAIGGVQLPLVELWHNSAASWRLAAKDKHPLPQEILRLLREHYPLYFSIPLSLSLCPAWLRQSLLNPLVIAPTLRVHVINVAIPLCLVPVSHFLLREISRRRSARIRTPFITVRGRRAWSASVSQATPLRCSLFLFLRDLVSIAVGNYVEIFLQDCVRFVFWRDVCRRRLPLERGLAFPVVFIRFYLKSCKSTIQSSVKIPAGLS